jgi:hypothetical protein
VTNEQAIIVAAVVGSLPAWAALYVSLHTQRKTLPAQTTEIKQHIDSSAAPADAGQVLARGDAHGA